MSTALVHHHHRSNLIAAGVAVLAVTSVGVIFEVNRDSAPASTGETSVLKPIPHFALTGGINEEGNWHHAGTTSGGHTPLDS
jgi:ABC-type proline/glycine betaine transport system permease subunit